MIGQAAAIAERLSLVQARIDSAARRGSRDPADVVLIAVTKTHGPEVVHAAYSAGLRHFGENRVEEAEPKIDEVRTSLPQDATWHMIGHIQSRKAAQVAKYFRWIHSVDRLKVARLLSSSFARDNQGADVLLEVNLSGEGTKSGYDLSRWPDDPAQEKSFYADVEHVLALPGLRLSGLMTVAPMVDTPDQVRPVFKRMRKLRERLESVFPGVNWRHLSMGMSGDFEVAIEEGATMIRVGTALFGPRA